MREAAEGGPRLIILSPRDGEVLSASASLQVMAVGIGRFGGILDTELLLDGRGVAESHIVFIRPPEPDEPVQHVFELDRIEAGEHTLVVREVDGEGVVSAPVQFRVVEAPPQPKPMLRIVSPAPGTVFTLGEPVEVQAVGVGREGGITHVELLLDGRVVAESQIVFIRPPSIDEPVYHQFNLDPPPVAGSHRLKVREVDNPARESEEVPFAVVAPGNITSPPLLRLTTLEDGTLVLMIKDEEETSRATIEVSTDLVHWQPVGLAGPALRMPVARSLSASRALSARYYRAISQP
jgi:hypothetical protein